MLTNSGVRKDVCSPVPTLPFPEGYVAGYISGRICEKSGMSCHGKALGKLTLYVDLGDVSLESVKARVKDNVITITGNRAEITEECDGMIRCNYHGFTKPVSLPEGADPNTLKLSTVDGYTLAVEVAYRGIPLPRSEDTCDDRNVFISTWAEVSQETLPLNWPEADLKPGASRIAHQSTGKTNREAKTKKVHNISESANHRKVSSIPVASVTPVRHVPPTQDEPAVFFYRNESCSMSFE